MRKFFLKTALTIGVMMTSSAAYAACVAPVAKDDLTEEQVDEIFACIKEELRAGYAKSDNPWAKEYLNWGRTAVRPAAPGPHGGRFLNTTVNEIGYREYIKYSDEREDNPMPVGTVIAKEVFGVNKKNKVTKGQLFFMEKVAAGNADEFGNWIYSVVKSNGEPQKISQKFCHDCHGAFSDQDAMGYPDEDVRLVSE
ncbi:MAG: cytochrome P460 family protein [Pseudomonadota bacterium]